ncbi:hypothetical protein AMK59_3858 [Oryctes borbonicus]|uniref:Serpin domain-containing protein n=1 Tax=Oryctes borbonicus TaxID=1629725 RepID=A0A0T6B823_9SCAR|nr:hypothetical protein AMK59_3858 [Oryctes borbonicus]
MIKYITLFSTVLLITAEFSSIPESINELAFQLQHVLPETNGNTLFSPLSAHIALILCHQGSSGMTRKILEDVLLLPSDLLEIAAEYKDILGRFNDNQDDVSLSIANGIYLKMHYNLNAEYKDILERFNDNQDDVSLSIANGIYLKMHYNLKSQFEEVAREYFKANIENVDFTKSSLITKQINDWVSTRTKQKIQDIIQESSLTEDTRVVLVNAVYFKGSWAHPFKMHETRKDKFYISDSETVDCQMMQTSGDFYYSESPLLDMKILKMPYVDKDISFVIVLPIMAKSLKKIETKLTAKKNLMTLVKDMNSENVEVHLPRFKLETNIDLRQPLQDVKNMFQ